ncbi:hypothetical protein ABZY90_17600 [Streptomyces sp. NPDC006422]|uniref:hypothetical protein n=1 Tax=unclassified Streptomyces TaxID=2593676 RepID=UPI0033A09351
MLIVALLLLPAMGLLLLGMDRIEDRMGPLARHSGHLSARHLRLVPGDDRNTREPAATRDTDREAA